MIKKPGRQPTRSEQLLLQDLVMRKVRNKNQFLTKVIVHHITEDTPNRLQLEVEWQSQVYDKKVIRFERLFL